MSFLASITQGTRTTRVNDIRSLTLSQQLLSGSGQVSLMMALLVFAQPTRKKTGEGRFFLLFHLVSFGSGRLPSLKRTARKKPLKGSRNSSHQKEADDLPTIKFQGRVIHHGNVRATPPMPPPTNKYGLVIGVQVSGTVYPLTKGFMYLVWRYCTL